jgi:hypothetical protein
MKSESRKPLADEILVVGVVSLRRISNAVSGILALLAGLIIVEIATRSVEWLIKFVQDPYPMIVGK